MTAKTAEIALIENLQRQDLSPLEEAEGYNRLMSEFSHTQEALGQALGKSRSHIANSLRLLGLPAPIKQMLSDKVLSSGHARALLGAENAVELAGQIVKKGLNVRQAEKLVKNRWRQGITREEAIRSVFERERPRYSVFGA